MKPTKNAMRLNLDKIVAKGERFTAILTEVNWSIGCYGYLLLF